MKESKLTYALQEPAKGVDKVVDENSIIEKRGHVLYFSLADIKKNKDSLIKLQTQLNGQLTLESAKMTNIETNHDFVTKLTAEELFTAHMYQDAKKIAVQCETKLKEISDVLIQEDKEVEGILKALPELVTIPEEKEVEKDDTEKPAK